MTTFRVIDFETTGFPTDDNPQALVEIGWTDVVDGVIGEPVSYLVNPGRPIEIGAMAAHHIRDKDVANAPSPDRVLIKLGAGNPDYFVAHNIDFERKFYSGANTPWLCTYKTALRVFKEADGHSNQFLRYALDIDDEKDFDRDLAQRPHRAPDDSYVTAFILRRILAQSSVENLLRWSSGPALLSKVNFGKHAGLRWSEVDTGYLRWIVGQDFDRDTLATAKYYLKVHAGEQSPTSTKVAKPEDPKLI